MGRVTTRKYGIYNTLQAALRRAGFEKTGVLTTLLLETFLENEGILTAKAVIKAGLCEKESFKEWREPLIKGGWLVYDHELAKRMGKGSYHQPGKKLNPYLNKEKMKTQSLVTESQLNESLAPLHARLDALEGFLRNIIEEYDPPYTTEKGDSYMSDPKAFGKALAYRIEVGKIEDDKDDPSFIKN